MNFDDLQSLWQSPHNKPTPQQIDTMKQDLTKKLRAQYRGFLILITLASIWLIIPTVNLAWHIAHGGIFDFRHEWGALIFLSLPLIALAVLTRNYRRHRSAHGNFEHSIQSTLRALLDENRLAQTRAKLIAILNLAMVVCLPLVVHQLRAVGKAGDEILFPAFVGVPIIVAVVLISLRVHHVRTLKPRQLELRSLLASYETPNQ